MRKLRDAVSAGADLDSLDYQEILTHYQAELKALRATMRADLGSPAFITD